LCASSDTPSFDSSNDNRRLTVEIGMPNERAARLMLSNCATLTNIRTSSTFCHKSHFAIFGNWIPQFPNMAGALRDKLLTSRRRLSIEQ
jgi:hypothetical protein